MRDGIGASLERVAEKAGVETGTLCRYFPTPEALPAAVLQTRSAELVPTGRTSPNSVTPPRSCGSGSGCGPWRSTSAPSAGCRNRSWPRPGRRNLATTEEYVRAAQRMGHVHPSVRS
ncbi:TetR family transcriptional regulator [Streptomyces tauricus]|uniref:TetR family transcriptional regulator n=1 Tax=Streptomyces tauricus TaxID=68274 RepID=A0ABZ1JSP2_9ACTN|nr:TetR family transcriptional regulator [Streptomyces tauricus]